MDPRIRIARRDNNFFIDVYNMHTGSISSSKEYSVVYGHKDGSGSLDFTHDEGSYGYSATKWNYSHYRQLVFGDELQEFNFKDNFFSSLPPA